MAVLLNPNPFLMKWGVILAHLIGAIVLGVLFFLFGFLYLLVQSESPITGAIDAFFISIFILWTIQILASGYSMWKLFKEEPSPRFRMILLPLGVLSLIVGLLFTYGFLGMKTIDNTIPLIGLFSLLVAITDFQTFRMLAPNTVKPKANASIQKKRLTKKRKK